MVMSASLIVLLATVFVPTKAEAASLLTTSGFPLSAGYMVPNTSVSGTFTLTNIYDEGTLNSLIAPDNVFDIDGMSQHMTLVIESAGTEYYNGSLETFLNGGPLTLTSMIEDGSKTFTFTLILNSDAPQSMAGKTLGFDLIIGFEGGKTQTISGTGGSGTRTNRFSAQGNPTVLGVSTDICEPYLTTTIRPNKENDTAEVLKLQTFLRDLEGHTNLEITGVYDNATQQAVAEFQKKYQDEVLRPWGLPLPTMVVYYTTRKMVNEIHCEFTREFPLSADQQAEIDRYRSEGGSYYQPQGNTGGNSTGSVLGTVTDAITTTTGEVAEQAVAAVNNATNVTDGFWQQLGGFFDAIWNWAF
jgi:hypothetical protein